MGLFDLFRNNNLSSEPKTAITKTSKNGDLESDMFRSLSYKDCQNLYSYIPLAKRIVNLPIKIAINNMNIKWGSEDEYKDEEGLKDIDINYIKTLCTDYISKVRLYGYSVLLPLVGPEDDVSKPLMKSEIYDKEIRYNILDPLNMTVTIDNNPASYNFKRITSMRVNNGPLIHSNRALALNNRLNNLYLQYNNASYNYVGLSELQISYPLINLLATSITSMERQLIHSSLMVVEEEKGSTNVNTQAMTTQADLLSQVKQDSVVLLRNGLKLNQFQLSNFDSIGNTIDKINNLISLSVDIPSALFCDESLSNGFGDGSNESQIVEMYLTDIRNSLIVPTMKFLLSYEVYNKVKDYKKATEIIDNIEIEFGIMFNVDEQLKNMDEMTEEQKDELLTGDGSTDEINSGIDNVEEQKESKEVLNNVKE